MASVSHLGICRDMMVFMFTTLLVRKNPTTLAILAVPFGCSQCCYPHTKLHAFGSLSCLELPHQEVMWLACAGAQQLSPTSRQGIMPASAHAMSLSTLSAVLH